MNHNVKFAIFLKVVILLVILVVNSDASFKYPKIRRDLTVIDDYHGTKIGDPYRFLEDSESEETKEFIRAENNLTLSYIEDAPYRKELRQIFTNLRNYPVRSAPKRHGRRYFYSANSGLQDQLVIMVQDSLDSEARIFLDLNTLSDDGTLALKSVSFSEDGNLFAYGISDSGSDLVSIHIKNVSSGENFPDTFELTKWLSFSWTHDNLGFFYSRFLSAKNNDKNSSQIETKLTENEKIYYHKIGTKQEEDKLILEFADKPKSIFTAEVSNDGNYLLVSVLENIDKVSMYFSPLQDHIKSGFKNELNLTLITNTPSSYSYVTNHDSLFYFLTDLNAPNYKLVRIDLNKPDTKHWSTVIPEEKQVLEWVIAVKGDMIFTSYTKDVKSTLELRHLKNGSLIKDFPVEIGSVVGSGSSDDEEFFFEQTTFTNPGIIYRIDLSEENISAKVYHEIKAGNLNSSNFSVEQVFYASKDGTKIPMFIFHRKDMTRDGSAPAYLYSYGGFGAGVGPAYLESYLVFVNNFHGSVAIPSIRGGNEYGQDWWDSGRLLKKQNSFDDFAAAAEYLINNNYTNPSKLVVTGASNGGMLVAATVNQRPELFGAAIPEVGVMDLLRFQKFTVGHVWCGEYGCSDNKTEFDNLLTFSPLHNIRVPKNGSQYPAILVKTADHDDRVVPLHSFKYIAELQHIIGSSSNQTNPLFIRIEKKAGHGGDTPTSKYIDAIVDDFTFIARALNYKFYA